MSNLINQHDKEMEQVSKHIEMIMQEKSDIKVNYENDINQYKKQM